MATEIPTDQLVICDNRPGEPPYLFLRKDNGDRLYVELAPTKRDIIPFRVYTPATDTLRAMTHEEFALVRRLAEESPFMQQELAKYHQSLDFLQEKFNCFIHPPRPVGSKQFRLKREGLNGENGPVK